MENKLSMVLAEKEEASAKRYQRRFREKEEQILIFVDIERKALEVQERKLELVEGKERSIAKEI
jgi:hypothetical protein